MANPIKCTFCFKKGVPLPHTHTLRAWKEKDKPICCPELLSTICNYCKKSGHTPQYCPILEAKRNNNIPEYSFYENKNKRSIQVEHEIDDIDLVNRSKFIRIN